MNADRRLPRTGKLFRNGRSQAVRIPAEYRFDGTEVEFRPGPNPGEVIIAPKPQRTGNWNKFFESLARVRPEDVPEGFPWRDQGQRERILPFGEDPSA